ncbi:MAG: glucose-6-phosphate isomerase [Chloroflexi bacterium]|nr:glucose-6-phosphate isomerase [Chloroflexota bacterium]
MDYLNPTWQAQMRIRLDINNALNSVVDQHGIDPNQLGAMADAARAAVLDIEHKRSILGWPDLPQQDVSAVHAMAAKVKHVENFVVLGIGGSALGNIAVQSALNHPFYNDLPRSKRLAPKLYVIDNSDPDLNAALIETLDPATTVYNVISKSGTTAETMASFLTVRNHLEQTLGADALKSHIILTTDPTSGFLRQIGQREGWPMLDLPPTVGGRFSVLSTVGLLSAAVTGIDIRALLAGAAYGYQIASNPDVLRNPAAVAAMVNLACAHKGQNMVVMMPYAHRLRHVADWFAQLWAESLGKRYDLNGTEVFVGTTPIKALGATDQHSQVQLYAEGPFDKLVNFIAVDQYQHTVTIPSAYTDLEGVSYLGGHTFNALIQAEQQATEIALNDAGRPNITHHMPAINAFTLGQLFMLFEMQTAIAGALLNINTFDQPGVEAGKIATYALLGRNGFAERRDQIAAARQRRLSQWEI